MAEDKHKSVRGTPEYVLFIGQHLGRGSMGNVCIARHRKKGTRYAAKLFTAEARTSHAAYIKRELDILQLIPKHDNVINLIAIEIDKHSQDEVVIMELCEGGSLQQILDQPQNYYGLPESEFMLVLKHISSALHHLYVNKIVHRDVKPGNILLSISADGRHTYKLTDFGASRSISAMGDAFKTMCGTEEYLYPAMHKKAFVRNEPNILFGAEVDLWSFAISLYQCATGQLPYRPLRGIREDRKVMYKLMTEKESGVISNVEKKDGTFQAFRELPATVRFSCVTRRVVTEMLARLMDISNTDDTTGAWSPAQFYHFVDHLFNMTTIRIFCADICDDLIIRIDERVKQDKKDHCYNYADLQREVSAELQREVSAELQMAEVSSRYQLLLISDGFTVRQSTDINDYLRAADKGENIYLFTGTTNKTLNLYIPELPEEGAVVDLRSDAVWSRTVFSNILYDLDLIQRCKDKQHQLICAHRALGIYCNLRRDSSLTRWQHLQRNQKSLKQRWHDTDAHFRQHHSSPEVHHLIDQASLRIGLADSQYQDHLLPLCSSILHKTWPIPGLGPTQCERRRIQETAEVTVQEAKPIHDMLIADKTNLKPSHNDMEIHRYNKKQLMRIHDEQQHILVKTCVNRGNDLLKSTTKEIRDLLKEMPRLEKLEPELTMFEQTQHECESSVSRMLAMERHGQNGQMPSQPLPGRHSKSKVHQVTPEYGLKQSNNQMTSEKALELSTKRGSPDARPEPRVRQTATIVKESGAKSGGQTDNSKKDASTGKHGSYNTAFPRATSERMKAEGESRHGWREANGDVTSRSETKRTMSKQSPPPVLASPKSIITHKTQSSTVISGSDNPATEGPRQPDPSSGGTYISRGVAYPGHRQSSDREVEAGHKDLSVLPAESSFSEEVATTRCMEDTRGAGTDGAIRSASGVTQSCRPATNGILSGAEGGYSDKHSEWQNISSSRHPVVHPIDSPSMDPMISAEPLTTGVYHGSDDFT